MYTLLKYRVRSSVKYQLRALELLQLIDELRDRLAVRCIQSASLQYLEHFQLQSWLRHRIARVEDLGRSQSRRLFGSGLADAAKCRAGTKEYRLCEEPKHKQTAQRQRLRCSGRGRWR